MNETISFGYWLRRQRKVLDLTQKQFAQQVGCALQTIQKLEADERRPSQAMAERLADVLALDLPERAIFLKVARAELGGDQLRPARSTDLPPRHGSRRRHTGLSLPVPATALIGRSREVASVCLRLERGDVRLLTLTGPGGIGKTRLALQIAAELSDGFADGVCFVALAAVSDPALVIPTVAQALGVQASSGQPLLASLKVHLDTRRLLLVLDNFEHVLAQAPIVAELLSAVSQLKVLVTSRASLQLYGEHEVAVPPLSLPVLQQAPSLVDLRQYEAVRLFVERAQAVKPDFALTDETAAAVVEICHRLDGLPLAIELAAARIRLFSPQGMLERLTSPLTFLTGGARDLPARSQTLRATIDWSYNLLPAAEQQVLARLAVLVSGWTLDAAETICGGDIADGIEGLIARSLVRPEPARRPRAGATPRFGMLETIREYALERLHASGEADAVRDRHLLFFRELAEEAEPHLKGVEQVRWLQRLEDEHPNIRAALAWSLAHGAYDDGARLATAITWFWHFHDHDREAYQWMRQLLVEEHAMAPATRARALPAAAFFAWLLGEHGPAMAWCEEGLRLSRETEERRGVVSALVMLGLIGREERCRAALFDEALDEARKLGDTWWIAIALWFKSEIYVGHDDEQAQALLEASLPLHRRSGDAWSLGLNLVELAELNYRRGEYDRAAALFEESLAHLTAIGHSTGIARSLRGFGIAAYDRGEYTRAAVLLDDALVRFRESGHWDPLSKGLCARSRVALAQRDAGRATVLLEESLALCQSHGDAVGTVRALQLLGRVALEQGELERARMLLTASLRDSQGQATYDILEALEGVAGLAAAGTHPREDRRPGVLRAVRMLGAAAAAREVLGIALPPGDRAAYERDVAAVRDRLDQESFDAVWAEGQGMTLEQAIAYALEQTRPH